ncbi:MAG: SIR2 family NAD-dependent protein deacylase [Beijerinckiaceae bacterium]
MTVILENTKEAAEALAGFIRQADIITGFTGAGVSTECGVPDFRSPGSPWMVNKPIPYAAFTASAEARQEAWRRKFVMDDTYAGARPGQGHMALAHLHKSGKMPFLITQNIDGLHQASGISADRVIELHGNGTYAKCLACQKRCELSVIRPHFERHGAAPACEACGGILKSATVSFGQAMPEREMHRAVQASLAAELFLAIGSSLVVFPAASLPQKAAMNGAKLVIINREPTALDSVAELVIRADIGSVLSAVAHTIAL